MSELDRRRFLKSQTVSAALASPVGMAAPSANLNKTAGRKIMRTSGLSKTRLERMHDVMAGYIDRGQVPGLVALVSRAGELHFDALGSLAVGGQSRVQRDTIFRIASMTKPVT